MIIQIQPGSRQQVLDALGVERDGFSGDDPPETNPDVIRFLAEKGKVFLYYVKKTPVAIIELLPIVALSCCEKIERDSPLAIVAANRERLFGELLTGNVIYHHGVATVPEFRRRGFARQLLNKMIQAFPRAPIVCFIEAGIMKEGMFVKTENTPSFRLHEAVGFKTGGIVSPPVYDNKVFYYICRRLP